MFDGVDELAEVQVPAQNLVYFVPVECWIDGKWSEIKQQVAGISEHAFRLVTHKRVIKILKCLVDGKGFLFIGALALFWPC